MLSTASPLVTFCPADAVPMLRLRDGTYDDPGTMAQSASVMGADLPPPDRPSKNRIEDAASALIGRARQQQDGAGDRPATAT
jgi:hypothetical protein